MGRRISAWFLWQSQEYGSSWGHQSWELPELYRVVADWEELYSYLFLLSAQSNLSRRDSRPIFQCFTQG